MFIVWVALNNAKKSQYLIFHKYLQKPGETTSGDLDGHYCGPHLPDQVNGDITLKKAQHI